MRNEATVCINPTDISILDVYEGPRDYISPFENERFQQALQATVNVYGLSKDRISLSKGRIKRWSDLASLWYTSQPVAIDVFYLALHYIHWGIYPECDISEETSNLLSLVERELLSCGDAFTAWKKNARYRAAFSKVVRSSQADKKRGPISHTRAFGRYLISRTWYEVVYKRHSPPVIDPLSSKHTIHSICVHAQIQANCCGFEQIIKRLIPASAQWSRAQWSNDLNIYSNLKKLYGFKLNIYSTEFDNLIWLLYAVWYLNNQPYIDAAISIKNMPYKLAEKIWPGDTQREIEKIFLLAYSRCKSVETRSKFSGRRIYSNFSYSDLKSSWLFRFVSNWLNKDILSPENREKIRRVVFDLYLK